MPIDYSDFSILHGEDDSVDVEIMQRVLHGFKFNGDYHNLSLGQDIVSRCLDTTLSLPGMILLDIGLPGLTGKEILHILRNSEHTLAVPIIMMSGSSSLRDYSDCIRMGANGYIVKTADRELHTNVCKNFIQGWAQLANQKFF